MSNRINRIIGFVPLNRGSLSGLTYSLPAARLINSSTLPDNLSPSKAPTCYPLYVFSERSVSHFQFVFANIFLLIIWNCCNLVLLAFQDLLDNLKCISVNSEEKIMWCV